MQDLQAENKKLKTLIKEIYEDLKFRAETEEDGRKVFNISDGILLEIEEVLKE